jgi:HEAT repeat protein
MTCDETKLLLTDYWSHTLDETQELAFEAHIATCEACHAETERLGVLWKNLALIPAASKEFDPSLSVKTRFYETLGAYRQGMEAAPKFRLRDRILALWPQQPAFQMAVSFALLVIGVGLGYQLRSDKPALHEQAGTPELAQLRGEVSSMRQMVALSLMQQQSAGERLRGVSYAYQAPSSDTEVLSALLRTINQDDSANVRLAAVDALHQFGSSPVTRAAIIQSIAKQDTPLVQIGLIDLLVDLKAKDAMPELVKLAADEKVNESVRSHAKAAIEKLS